MCQTCDHPGVEAINRVLIERDKQKDICCYCGRKFASVLSCIQHRKLCDQFDPGIFAYTWREIAERFGVPEASLRYHSRAHLGIEVSYTYSKADSRPADRQSPNAPVSLGAGAYESRMERIHRDLAKWRGEEQHGGGSG